MGGKVGLSMSKLGCIRAGLGSRPIAIHYRARGVD